jgi:ABC-type transport system involved in multi-copper enzyme maturation permease subunit
MLLPLLSKEIKLHLKTFRFSAALIVTFTLIILSVWVLGNDFVARSNLYLKLSESYKQGSESIFVPSQIKPVMHKPPTPLSIFAQGDERRLGNTVIFSRWSVPSEAVDHLTNNKLTADHISYDLMTIFALIISLFSLLLTYDAISGERETGTLKFICSFRLSRASIYSIKFLAGLIVISLPFLISFAGALLVLSFIHGIAFTAEQWIAKVLMVLSGLIYSAVFVAVGLLCSTIARRSSSSLVLALFFWALAVLLIPGAANGIAKYIAPLHPPEEIKHLELTTEAEVKKQLADYRQDATPYAGQGSWMGAWIVDENVAMFDTFSVAQYLQNVEYVRYQENLRQVEADRIWDAQKVRLKSEGDQAALADLISSISPSNQLQTAFTGLSGTSYEEYERFLDACRRYRQTILNDFSKRGYFDKNTHDFFMRMPRELFKTEEQFDARWHNYTPYIDAGIFEQAIKATGYFDKPLDEDFIPPFQYRGGRPDFNAAAWPIGLLFSMTVIAFLLGFTLFIRYDVR